MSETLSSASQTSSLARELVEPLTSKAAFYFSLAHRHVRRARTKRDPALAERRSNSGTPASTGL